MSSSSVKKWHHPPRVDASEYHIKLITVLFWTLSVWGVMIGRFIFGAGSDYVTHLTNWNWTIQGIFYFLALVVTIANSTRFTFVVHIWMFFLAYTFGWLIFWLAFVMVGDSPNQILDLIDTNGGEYPAGVVFIMDRVLHVLPAVMNLIYIFLFRHELRYMVSYFLYNNLNQRDRQTELKVIGWILFLGITFPVLALYGIIFNPQAIYDLTIPTWVLGFIALGIVLITVIFTVYLLAYKRPFESFLDDTARRLYLDNRFNPFWGVDYNTTIPSTTHLHRSVRVREDYVHVPIYTYRG